MADETTPPAAPAALVPPTPYSALQKPTDKAARPGFRSPANNKTKAQKKKK